MSTRRRRICEYDTTMAEKMIAQAYSADPAEGPGVAQAQAVTEAQKSRATPPPGEDAGEEVRPRLS